MSFVFKLTLVRLLAAVRADSRKNTPTKQHLHNENQQADIDVTNFIYSNLFRFLWRNDIMPACNDCIIYILAGLPGHLLREKAVSIEGTLECVTVEIQVNEPISKTCVISCIYRTPGSNIHMFFTGMAN